MYWLPISISVFVKTNINLFIVNCSPSRKTINTTEFFFLQRLFCNQSGLTWNAKDSNRQTITAWKVWISHDLARSNVLAFFCHDKIFGFTVFKSLSCSLKTLGMRRFVSEPHNTNSRLLKTTASRLTCHFCKQFYYKKYIVKIPHCAVTGAKLSYL